MTSEYSLETPDDATAGVSEGSSVLSTENASANPFENLSTNDIFRYENVSNLHTLLQNEAVASKHLLHQGYHLDMSGYIDEDNIINNNENYNISSVIPSIYSSISVTAINATDWTPMSHLLSGYSPLHVALASILVTAIMIGIVFGNILVILAIAKDRNLQSLQHWFITSLAVADLLVGTTVMPFSLANELMGWWYFGDFLCELWLALDVLLSTASILNLCLISLDRYWSITRPITYVKFRTRKRAVAMIATVWILSAIICFPPLVGWNRPQRKLSGFPLCELTDDIGYVLYSTLGSFYIPLVVMVVVYFKIYLAARSRARRGLKKNKLAAIGNGKHTSTLSMTTSFGTTTRGQTCMENNKHDHSMSFEDDDNCLPLDDLDSPSTEPDPEAGESVTLTSDLASMNVPNNTYFKNCGNLLSDETDVTDSVDSSRRLLLRRAIDNRRAHIFHISESESASDCSLGQANQIVAFELPRQQCIENGNSKPLLEEESTESNRELETEVWMKQHEVIVNNIRQDTLTQNNSGNHTTPCQQRTNRGKKKLNLFNVSKFSLSCTGSIFTKKINMEKEKEKHNRKRSVDQALKAKRRLAKARERRATFVLGIIMAVFIFCWLPFFLSYLIVSLGKIHAPKMLFAIFFWAGYCNSALNPVIYTIFNKDFRNAFSKLLAGTRQH